MRSRKIWHIGAWNRNIGDWALAYHMHRLLREEAEAREWCLDFYLVDGQRTFFHPELVDQINAEADMVLLGGGGNLFHRPEDQSVSGWMFNISPAELDRIRAPIVVYGIGYNRFPYDPNEFPPVTALHLRALQAKARLFSVRNQGTRRVMADEFGLITDDIEVIPDAGIHLYDRPVTVPTLDPSRPTLAVNLAGDRPHFRYAEPSTAAMKHFLSGIKDALLRASVELNAQIMFLPHLLGIDSDFYPDFAADFPKGSIFSTHIDLPFLYRPPGESLYPVVPFFTNLFRQADVVLGMRAHTCILAFGALTKFIALGEHQKLKYFGEEFGLPSEYLISKLPAFDAADVAFASISGCLKDASYQRLIEKEHPKLDQRLHHFNQRVLDILA